jgi:hypothetical protein
MSQGAVEMALGKLVTDDAFRNRFFVEPSAASVTAGFALSQVELDALTHLSPQALANFSRRLDARIRRLPLDGDKESMLAGRLEAGAGHRRRAVRADAGGGGEGLALPKTLGAVGGISDAQEHQRCTGPTRTITVDQRRKQMKTLKKTVLAVIAVGLLVGGTAVLALAQSSQGMGGDVPSYPADAYRSMDTSQPGWVHTSSQVELTVDGKIAAVDFAHRTLTLSDGEQFMLPGNLEYATLPAIGQAVEVTFAEQNGQKVVRWIDLDDTADSHNNS